MFKKSLIALSLTAITLLSGCNNDGDTGQQGPQGDIGQQGDTGPQGTATTTGLAIEVVGRFASGLFGQSAAEIVQFHKTSQSAFAINGALNRIEVINLGGLSTSAVANPIADESLSTTAFTFPATVTVATTGGASKEIVLGDANSIAIHQDTLALAVAAQNKTDNGAVLFFSLDNNGSGTFIKAVETGALPDMVAFTNNGEKVLIANEGEPTKDFSVDPEGSISVVAIADNTPNDVAQLINFTSDITFASDLLSAEDYDSEAERRQLLQQSGVKFASVPGTTVAQDLEPEYIAVAADDKTAWVSLQENNAIGIIDLENMTIDIRALGYKDWSQHQLDYANKDNMPNPRSVDGLYGLYQPDTIAAYQYNGVTFVVSANEGDAREYIYQTDEATCIAANHQYDDGDCIAYNEEKRIKDVADELSDDLKQTYQQHGGSDGLGRLKITSALGKVDTDDDGIADQYQALYAYDARSFSIWDQNAHLVYDSGDDFETISAAILGSNFNSAHTENKGDNRSDDKGGEPEAIAVGAINNQQYAFISLERSGDLFAYDITNPFNPEFISHYNNRDFTTEFEMDDDLADPCDINEGMDCSQVALSGDLGPESIKFVDAADSPNGNALLIVGNEVSGTVTVYQVKAQ
jgi:hypothetical protein